VVFVALSDSNKCGWINVGNLLLFDQLMIMISR